MQSKKNNEVQFGQALNLLKNVAKVSSIDKTSDLKDVLTKLIRLRNYGMMTAWTMILSVTFQLWQKYQDRGKSLAYTGREYMPLLSGVI